MPSQERKTCVGKRVRVNFTGRQLETFEAVFQQSQYPDVAVLETLADKIGLPTEKICTWFQNRRSKFRKESKKGHIMWMRQQLFSESSSGTKAPKSTVSSVLTPATTSSGTKEHGKSADYTAPSSSLHYKPPYQPPVNGCYPPSTTTGNDVALDYLNIPPITASYLSDLQNDKIESEALATNNRLAIYGVSTHSTHPTQASYQQTRSACAYSRTNYTSTLQSTVTTPTYSTMPAQTYTMPYYYNHAESAAVTNATYDSMYYSYPAANVAYAAYQ